MVQKKVSMQCLNLIAIPLLTIMYKLVKEYNKYDKENWKDEQKQIY